MASIRIAIVDNHPTISFAAAELQRCLAQATAQPVAVLDRNAISRATPALWRGLAQHFPGVARPPAAAAHGRSDLHLMFCPPVGRYDLGAMDE